MNEALRRFIHPAGKILQSYTAAPQSKVLAFQFSTQKLKKPPNAFLLYCMDKRNDLSTEEQSLKRQQKQQQKIFSNGWKELTEEEKKPYQLKFEELAHKHKLNVSMLSDTELQKIKDEQREIRKTRKDKALARANKKELKEAGKPTQPMSSYILYYRNMLKSEGNLSGKSASELTKGFNVSWNAMSQEDKKPYIEEAKQLREQYDKEMIEFTERMWKANKHHLIPKKYKQKFIV